MSGAVLLLTSVLLLPAPKPIYIPKIAKDARLLESSFDTVWTDGRCLGNYEFLLRHSALRARQSLAQEGFKRIPQKPGRAEHFEKTIGVVAIRVYLFTGYSDPKSNRYFAVPRSKSVLQINESWTPTRVSHPTVGTAIPVPPVFKRNIPPFSLLSKLNPNWMRLDDVAGLRSSWENPHRLVAVYCLRKSKEEVLNSMLADSRKLGWQIQKGKTTIFLRPPTKDPIWLIEIKGTKPYLWVQASATVRTFVTLNYQKDVLTILP
jgi:hypothetical protein